ncbi:MAG: SHOCT domain-containing protein [Candidatus Bathyarchaeota archaeon]|jgi:uncharacterized membrane protein|nr:SHOCT domain-containing protein [Candidatus Bathyarchaeota archaeon]
MSCSVFTPFGWTNQMWNMPFGGMGWGMWLGLIVLAAVGYWIFSSTYLPRAYRVRRKEDPLETARMRLARGEISVEEFEEIKAKLLR